MLRIDKKKSGAMQSGDGGESEVTTVDNRNAVKAMTLQNNRMTGKKSSTS